MEQMIKIWLKKSVAASLVIGVFLTVILMIVSVLFLHPLLKVLDTPKDIIDEAYAYISTITIFVGVMFLYNLCGVLRAIGNSVMPLVFLIISSLLNIVLDIVFIVEFNMEIKEQQLRLLFPKRISAILCIIYIYSKCKILIPEKKTF